MKETENTSEGGCPHIQKGLRHIDGLYLSFSFNTLTFHANYLKINGLLLRWLIEQALSTHRRGERPGEELHMPSVLSEAMCVGSAGRGDSAIICA